MHVVAPRRCDAPQSTSTEPHRHLGREAARRALPRQERSNGVSGGGLSGGLRRLPRGLPRRLELAQGRESRKGGLAARMSRTCADRALSRFGRLASRPRRRRSVAASPQRRGVAEASRRRRSVAASPKLLGVAAASPRPTRSCNGLSPAQGCVWVSRFMNRLAALGEDGRYGRGASRKSTGSSERADGELGPTPSRPARDAGYQACPAAARTCRKTCDGL